MTMIIIMHGSNPLYTQVLIDYKLNKGDYNHLLNWLPAGTQSPTNSPNYF